MDGGTIQCGKIEISKFPSCTGGEREVTFPIDWLVILLSNRVVSSAAPGSNLLARALRTYLICIYACMFPPCLSELINVVHIYKTAGTKIYRSY